MSRQQEPRTVSELKERAAALPDGGGLYSYSEHRDSNGTLRIEAVVIDDPAMFRSLSYRTVFPLFSSSWYCLVSVSSCLRRVLQGSSGVFPAYRNY